MLPVALERLEEAQAQAGLLFTRAPSQKVCHDLMASSMDEHEHGNQDKAKSACHSN